MEEGNDGNKIAKLRRLQKDATGQGRLEEISYKEPPGTTQTTTRKTQ